MTQQDRPGPQPHNAGLTPGYQGGDGVAVNLTAELEERIRNLEFDLERLTRWAKRTNRRHEAMEERQQQQQDRIDQLERFAEQTMPDLD